MTNTQIKVSCAQLAVLFPAKANARDVVFSVVPCKHQKGKFAVVSDIQIGEKDGKPVFSCVMAKMTKAKAITFLHAYTDALKAQNDAVLTGKQHPKKVCAFAVYASI